MRFLATKQRGQSRYESQGPAHVISLQFQHSVQVWPVLKASNCRLRKKLLSDTHAIVNAILVNEAVGTVVS